jgi:CheY-like chemotaxis protein
MARVLCTGADPVLLETRRLILERAGHTVITAANQVEVVAACERNGIDVAVIGHSIPPHIEIRIASLIRSHCPAAKILELYPLHRDRLLTDADSWMEVPADMPEDLAKRVTWLADPRSTRLAG